MTIRLSLGPNLFYWPKQQTLDFYRQMAATPVDIIYLGETICSKRKLMRTQDWLELADELAAAGKEVVLSTLALSEAESDIKTLNRICSNDKYMVEANDMGAVNLLQGKAFVSGHSVNVYNHQTIQVLAKVGLKRWVMPVELDKNTLLDLHQQKPEHIETELFAFGRLPLAYSARCFTARAHNLQKDDCQYRCLDYPDGMLMNTQEDQKFLNINGIQTQSAQSYNLLSELNTIKDSAIDILRLSPQSRNMDKIIQIFHDCIHQNMDLEQATRQLQQLAIGESCNGYWHGVAGIKTLHEQASI
ncbi:MAG: U32 family peptidase [Gammaproteobacteria bacterium]|nr:U32 family peptidase [Gammaproteobacteria bacterium]